MPTPTTRDLARIAYDAYAQSTGGKTFDGRPMPTFEQIVSKSPHVAQAWEAAAASVVAYHTECMAP